MKKLILVSLIAMLFSFAFAKEITVAVGLSLPPYVISENNNGIELDILREALKPYGYKINPIYVPLKRVAVEISQKHAQAALTVNENSGLKNVFFSDSHIAYQNAVIALKSKNWDITKLSDLDGKSILAFANAHKYLGKEFRAYIKGHKNYEEINNQEVQVARLFGGRTDVLISDINIFKYYRINNSKADTSAPVKIYKIFPKTNYKIAFTDSKIRDQFNEGLQNLKKSGRYQKIINKYIEK